MLGLGDDDDPGAHPPPTGERGDQFVGELLGDEHDRLEVRDRFVEGALGAPFRGRVGGARWTIVTTASETVHVQPGAPESRVHVAGREGGEVAEGAQPEADEELDQLGRGVADISQPAHRERRQVGSRLPWCDHAPAFDPRPAGRNRHVGPAGRNCRGDTPVGDADADRRARQAERVEHAGDDRGEPRRECHVAPVVARRAAGGEAQPTGLDDVEPR